MVTCRFCGGTYTNEYSPLDTCANSKNGRHAFPYMAGDGFVRFHKDGSVSVDLKNYLKSPRGQAQLESLRKIGLKGVCG